MLHRFSRHLLAAGAAASFALALPVATAQAKQVVSADGPGDTYALLGRVFSIETPDCGHKVEHVTEIFDDELKKNVFVFHAHVNEDDDRCGAQDRQRTEIRGGKLADVYAATGQTVYYRWKFKLPMGFQIVAELHAHHADQVRCGGAHPDADPAEQHHGDRRSHRRPRRHRPAEVHRPVGGGDHEGHLQRQRQRRPEDPPHLATA